MGHIRSFPTSRLSRYLIFGDDVSLLGFIIDDPHDPLTSQLRVNVTGGRIRCSGKGAVLTRGEERVATREGEQCVYQYLSAAEGLSGFQDHFDW